MEIDKNHQRLAAALTWHDWPASWQLTDVYSGMLIKSASGEIFIIGGLDDQCRDSGCGCCSDAVQPVAYADIYELIEGRE
jgi:hypothetical protein